MLNTIPLDKARDPVFTAEVERRSGQNISKCYQCGNCTAGCPAGFVYDRQVSQMMRAVQLGLREQALTANSIWYCLSCQMCTMRCPNEIDVAGVMETLRHMAREEGIVSVPAAEKFWFSFMDTVRTFGRAYEIGTMALYMMRSKRFGTDLDLAPTALKKHKLPFLPYFSHDKSGSAVARIIDRYRKRASNEGVRS